MPMAADGPTSYQVSVGLGGPRGAGAPWCSFFRGMIYSVGHPCSLSRPPQKVEGPTPAKLKLATRCGPLPRSAEACVPLAEGRSAPADLRCPPGVQRGLARELRSAVQRVGAAAPSSSFHGPQCVREPPATVPPLGRHPHGWLCAEGGGTNQAIENHSKVDPNFY